MTLLSDAADFSRRFGAAIDEFRRLEVQIRRQHAQAEPDQEYLLERATRRFLVDDLLRALDWDPANPSQIAEEARSKSKQTDRFYFDYLGISPGTDAPVLLVEAKGFDVQLPRKAYGPKLDAAKMAKVIAEAVDALKRNDSSIPIIAEWAEFLRDLRDYVISLGELGRITLRRAAITAGGWIVVFQEPIATFQQSDKANSEHIVCFASLDDMLLRADEVYQLLHRSRLIDTLPATLKVSEALKMIAPDSIGACFKAVLVATTMGSGARRQQYPTRSIYAALLIDTGGRLFAVVDYEKPLEEPKRTDRIESLIEHLKSNGAELLQRLAQRYGRVLQLSSLDQFPGFPAVPNPQSSLAEVVGRPEELAAERPRVDKVEPRSLVTSSGERGAAAEFILVTGSEWFYKLDRQDGPECRFHYWKTARNEGVAAGELHTGYVTDSFTEDGQDRHCAHSDLLSLRAERCHLRAIESHLCCKACIFASECWSTEGNRLPCPVKRIG